jgi:hypothetical protein
MQVEGKPTQRLTIRFERAGLKKMAASLADLDEPELAPRIAEAEEHHAASAALGKVDLTKIVEVLTGVPESVRDPFVPLAERVRRALDLYRFNGAGGSVLDWAAMQSGLADPLSRFTRHDLETYFARFRRALDAHAGKIAMELVRSDPATAAKIVAESPPEARAAMRRLAGRR